MENKEHKNLLKAVQELGRKLDGIEKIINADVRSSDRLISVKEASKILNRSEYCLRIDINAGKIPAKKVGRGYLLSYNQVQKMVCNPDGL